MLWCDASSTYYIYIYIYIYVALYVTMQHMKVSAYWIITIYIYIHKAQECQKIMCFNLLIKVDQKEEEEEERKLYFNNLLHIHQHTFLRYMIQSVIEGNIRRQICL